MTLPQNLILVVSSHTSISERIVQNFFQDDSFQWNPIESSFKTPIFLSSEFPIETKYFKTTVSFLRISPEIISALLDPSSKSSLVNQIRRAPCIILGFHPEKVSFESILSWGSFVEKFDPEIRIACVDTSQIPSCPDEKLFSY